MLAFADAPPEPLDAPVPVSVEPADTVTTTSVPAPEPQAAPSTTTSTTTTVPDPLPGDRVLLVWTPGRLPDGFAAQVAQLAGVEAVTVVRSELVGLTAWHDGRQLVGAAPNDFEIPLETAAVDPASYPDFVPAEVRPLFASLGPGEALLGATSAALRGLGAGGELELSGGATLTVRAVVDDAWVGGAEVAVAQDGGTDIATERYLLARYDGDRAVLEEKIRVLLPAATAVRLRAPGETPVLRHGDAVLPQAQIKARFGEFAYRLDGDGFRQDPAWVEQNIVTADLPIVGVTRCHRVLVPMLEGALDELVQRNLAFLVDPDGFRGCWNPRFIAGRKGISRHAWGAAADLNFGDNPTGLASAQDPRLLEVMERWGFTSGHDWLVPDPGHFEFVRPPRP